MATPKYRISKQAIQDLESIWRYTKKNWSEHQADRYYRLLIAEIEYLAEHPNSGKSYEHVRTDYRASKVKSHLVFYRKLGDDPLEVVRILHQRMDLKTRLK